MSSTEKVIIQFQNCGDTQAPGESWKKVQIEGNKKFSEVVAYLKRKLKNDNDIFVYIRNAFSPSLDEEVGILSKAYKDINGVLHISYASQPMYG